MWQARLLVSGNAASMVPHARRGRSPRLAEEELTDAQYKPAVFLLANKLTNHLPPGQPPASLAVLQVWNAPTWFLSALTFATVRL